MSAFLVSKKHIDCLVATAIAGPRDVPVHPTSWTRPWAFYYGGKRYEVCPETADVVGRLLWTENLRSLAYRYPNDASGERPGPAGLEDAEIAAYTHPLSSSGPVRIGPDLRLSPVAALKAIDCYEYQSCEHPARETSAARAFCEGLRHSLGHTLPGYKDAPWGID